MGLFKKAKKKLKKTAKGVKNIASSAKKGKFKEAAGQVAVSGAAITGVQAVAKLDPTGITNNIFQDRLLDPALGLGGLEAVGGVVGAEGSGDSDSTGENPELTAQREEDSRNLELQEERKRARRGRLVRSQIGASNLGAVTLGRPQLLGV